jgi:membrane-bound acyltransferase YfiQ involved in biofilm formation
LFISVVFVANTICHAPVSITNFFMIYLVFRIKMNLIPTHFTLFPDFRFSIGFRSLVGPSSKHSLKQPLATI